MTLNRLCGMILYKTKGRIMEKIFDIIVKLGETISVSGKYSDIHMISFTGTAVGKYFNGTVIGSGVDTQKISKSDGAAVLSARYMLEGNDADGEKCRIFIENTGSPESGYCPHIVTDSKALAWLETAEMSAEIKNCENGVIVSICGAEIL